MQVFVSLKGKETQAEEGQYSNFFMVAEAYVTSILRPNLEASMPSCCKANIIYLRAAPS